MCFMEISKCPTCKKKYDYIPSFCEKIHKGMICVDKDLPATRDARYNDSTLMTSIRFDDRFDDRVMYLSDVMVMYELDLTCDQCIEKLQAETNATE
jgi:hypothetical protein